MTLCAGKPDYAQLSPMAQEYHAAWGNLDDLIVSRKSEDFQALKLWDVDVRHCNTLDSIYRRIDGRIVYPDSAALFADPDPRDAEAQIQKWRQELDLLKCNPAETILYAPLAAGNHVDHQITRVFAKQLIQEDWQVWFYEDFPHAETIGLIEQAQASFTNVAWQSKTVLIEVNAKLDAIRKYESQVRFMFRSDHDMVRRVKQFTATRAIQVSKLEQMRFRFAGSGGRRERMWRRILGYHAHAERLWRIV